MVAAIAPTDARAADVDDPRWLIGEDRGEGRRVAGEVVPRREQVANGRLVLGETVEAAHPGALPPSPLPDGTGTSLPLSTGSVEQTMLAIK